MSRVLPNPEVGNVVVHSRDRVVGFVVADVVWDDRRWVGFDENDFVDFPLVRGSSFVSDGALIVLPRFVADFAIDVVLHFY